MLWYYVFFSFLIKISKYYIALIFTTYIVYFFVVISKSYSLLSMILSFVKFEILSFWVWIFIFKILYFVKKTFKDYTTIFEFGSIHKFEFSFVTTLIHYFINFFEFLVILSKFFSTYFVIIFKRIIITILFFINICHYILLYFCI